MLIRRRTSLVALFRTGSAIAAVVGAATAPLAGCGQKGALMLPQAPAAAPSAPAR
jgi:predicted small lipoprotein YifL